MGVSEWNVPIDLAHKISMALLAQVRAGLLGIHDPDWEPAPMPDSYHPSPDDRLHPAPYDASYASIDRLPLQPHRNGDAVIFYDYGLTVGHHSVQLVSLNRPGTPHRSKRR